MDPNSLLEQLRDVHSPESIGVWPPAIGWIILVLLIITATITIAWLSFRWYRSNAWRRAALKEFKRVQVIYIDAPSSASLSEISSLLKRCSASINQDSRILSMTGKTWRQLLETPKSPLNEHEIELLCFGHYQPECDILDRDALSRIRKWIKTLRPIFKDNTEINLPNLDDKFENKTS
jgi:hypothetical protein